MLTDNGVATGAIVTGLLIDHLSLGNLLNSQAAIYLIGGTLAFLLTAPHQPHG